MIMNRKHIFAAVSALLMSATVLSATDFRDILKLQKRGVQNRASLLYSGLSRDVRSSEPEGYAILCDICLNMDSYEMRMEEFIKNNPHSILVPQLRLAHALNLFEAQDYITAAEVFAQIPVVQLFDKQLDEYLFKKAYCELEKGDADRALLQFMDIVGRPESDYSAPVRYSIAYINYRKGNIVEAMEWFEKSSADSRFAEISAYYIMECRFIQKDYKYVTRNASKVYKQVLDERKPYLARIISESYLVQGDADNARKYYDLAINATNNKNTRDDWFYSGSVLYAVKDYKGAIESYNMMESRTDSIGQIANYHLGYSYIQTKNKVAALEAFKEAVQSDFNPAITQDAYFNWAKLAFDVNKGNTSIFYDYMGKYPNREKDDQIYNYIAVASLYDRNYAAAIDAYGEVDMMDERMKRNYMKANYLRAEQLIRSGSYSSAIVCLNSARYYSNQLGYTRLNQMTRYWLAESYFRLDKYQEAREIFVQLYNESALFNLPESYLITYNIAYCYFKEENYQSAQDWFNRYLNETSVVHKKEALERAADCYFVLKDYKNATQYYDMSMAESFDVNEIWPYWRSAISYGLIGNTREKVRLLSNVLNADPSARFYPDALCELGRAYVMMEQDAKAIECFKMLADDSKIKDNNWVARAYVELGSIARNQSKFNEALDYYKHVVEKISLSDRVEDALAAIESIYMTRNNPVGYIEYIESVGRGEMISADEKENMIFNAAEQVYMTENYERALVVLRTYLDKYPYGKYSYKAEFYTAQSHRILGDYEQACTYYAKVIDRGEPAYTTQSMIAYSELSYRLENWEDAYGGYSALYSRTSGESNKRIALLGMMRSAFRWSNWSESLKTAEMVLGDKAYDSAVKREASYIKAKALMASNRRGEALAEMAALAKDVRDQYGAEAAYLLILDSYDNGDFAAVEEKVFAFAETGTRYPYWMAKSFIVLGDAYVDMNEIEQAKATYESVRDGYQPTSQDDDVLDNVRVRLSKLN